MAAEVAGTGTAAGGCGGCGEARGRCRAVVKSVEEGSPAAAAGLRAGMVLTHVEGEPLRDIIEWRWQADGFAVEVTLEDGRDIVLERELGQDWGIEFSDVIFDGLMTCVNACVFCFMRMLPPDMRPTLYERDDDYRLSFLQGTFVTLTNVTDDDVCRIVECDLSPLHVSLHAISPDVRRELMGANAQRGLDVLEYLLECGIDVHVQLVVCPGVNDGTELMRTLSWVEAHPGVLSCGIVPLGYTKFQDRFSSSFSDDPAAAARVIELVREFQEDSGTERLVSRYHLSDEFYLDAGYEFPPASYYGEFPQFQDGIGMMRSFIDEFRANEELIARQAAALANGPAPTVVVGKAFERVLRDVLDESALAGLVDVLAVENEFFGGNVDVTGLIVGRDALAALEAARPRGRVIMARECLNPENRFLDDVPLSAIEQAVDGEVVLCTYCAPELLEALA